MVDAQRDYLNVSLNRSRVYRKQVGSTRSELKERRLSSNFHVIPVAQVSLTESVIILKILTGKLSSLPSRSSLPFVEPLITGKTLLKNQQTGQFYKFSISGILHKHADFPRDVFCKQQNLCKGVAHRTKKAVSYTASQTKRPTRDRFTYKQTKGMNYICHFYSCLHRLSSNSL